MRYKTRSQILHQRGGLRGSCEGSGTAAQPYAGFLSAFQKVTTQQEEACLPFEATKDVVLMPLQLKRVEAYALWWGGRLGGGTRYPFC